jgi:hypothetical protein
MQSFNPTAGQTVKVRHACLHAGMIGTVAHVRPGSGNRPTLIAVDVEPNRQLDFVPAELEVIAIPPFNGRTDLHYRRAGDLRAWCACGERFTEEHLTSVAREWERDCEERATDAGRQAYAERVQDAAIDRVAARESAGELINGCNVEACLTYARERIAALESERDSWRDTAQVLDRELTRVRREQGR